MLLIPSHTDWVYGHSFQQAIACTEHHRFGLYRIPIRSLFSQNLDVRSELERYIDRLRDVLLAFDMSTPQLDDIAKQFG
jgi:hypothetical protein